MDYKDHYNDTSTIDDLLRQSYSLFKLAIYGRGNLGLNISIRRKVWALKLLHNINKEYLVELIFFRYKSNKHYLKYDSNKASLRTFILHYTKNALIDLIREYDLYKKRDSEVIKNHTNDDSKLHIRVTFSLKWLEQENVESVIEHKTPEDYYFAKELYGLMIDFFETEELKVLFGLADRATEATESGIGYQALCKRIQRKREAFRPVLEEAGYL